MIVEKSKFVWNMNRVRMQTVSVYNLAVVTSGLKTLN